MDRDLRHDHDELRAIMGRFASAMARGPDTFRATLQRDRVLFSQLFRAHMNEEETRARLALRDDPARIEGSAALQLLFRDYSAHISHWSPAQIDADWDGYRAAVLALQRRLLARMDWEEREIHPRLPKRSLAA